MPTTLHTCDIPRCMTARWHACDTCHVTLTVIGYIGLKGEALCGDCEQAQVDAFREGLPTCVPDDHEDCTDGDCRCWCHARYDEDAGQDAVAGRPHWGTSDQVQVDAAYASGDTYQDGPGGAFIPRGY